MLDYFIVGVVSLITPPPVVVQCLREYLQNCGMAVTLSDGCKVQTFFRLLIRDNLYFSKNYGRVKKRNSYTIIYKISGKRFCGIILYFFNIQGHYLAVVTKLELQVVPSFTGVPTFRTTPAGYDVFSVSCIEQKCLYMNTAESGQYISCFPCNLRSD